MLLRPNLLMHQGSKALGCFMVSYKHAKLGAIRCQIPAMAFAVLPIPPGRPARPPTTRAKRWPQKSQSPACAGRCRPAESPARVPVKRIQQKKMWVPIHVGGSACRLLSQEAQISFVLTVWVLQRVFHPSQSALQISCR